MTPQLRSLPLKDLWMNYDDGADVLYINIGRPQSASDSDYEEAGIIKRWRGKKLVGMTILQASKRSHKK